MKIGMRSDCCDPRNCLWLWTPRRPEGDLCVWQCSVTGSMVIPWAPLGTFTGEACTGITFTQGPFQKLYGVRLAVGTETSGCAPFTLQLTPDVEPELLTGFDMAWPATQMPPFCISAGSRTVTHAFTENQPIGAFVPPETITATWDDLFWRLPTVFDSMQTISVPTGANGSGPMATVEVFYNQTIGKGPVSLTSGSHETCCTDRDDILVAHNATASVPIWTNLSNNTYLGSLNQTLIDQTSPTVQGTLTYSEFAQFNSGTVTAGITAVSSTFTHELTTCGYTWTGPDKSFEILASRQGTVSGTLGSHPAFVAQLQTLPDFLGPGFGNTGNVYLEHLCAAMGEAYDPTAAYVLQLRTNVNPNAAANTFSFPFCGPVIADGQTLPYANQAANMTQDLFIDAELIYTKESISNPFTTNTNHFVGEQLNFSGAPDDATKWRQRDEFSFAIGSNNSTVPNVSADLTALRNGCPLP